MIFRFASDMRISIPSWNAGNARSDQTCPGRIGPQRAVIPDAFLVHRKLSASKAGYGKGHADQAFQNRSCFRECQPCIPLAAPGGFKGCDSRQHRLNRSENERSLDGINRIGIQDQRNCNADAGGRSACTEKRTRASADRPPPFDRRDELVVCDGMAIVAQGGEYHGGNQNVMLRTVDAHTLVRADCLHQERRIVDITMQADRFDDQRSIVPVAVIADEMSLGTAGVGGDVPVAEMAGLSLICLEVHKRCTADHAT